MNEVDTSAGQVTRLPSRAVVGLPDLTILHRDLDTPADDTIRSIRSFFTAEMHDVIDGEILPLVQANQIWSGELACTPQPDGSTTAVTLWVPHQLDIGTPEAATVLIGTAVVGQTGQVAPDPLTGLPTRVVLLDRLDLARRRSRRNNDLMAALFVDLDGLKAINDRLGHEEGDSALMAAAERIRACLRDGDTVARFGGDEFVVLCESLEEETQAERVAERILETLSGEVDSPLSASIGVAFDRGGSLNALELIGRADAAMYRAKSRGGARFAVFDSEMQGRIAADESLRARLLAAINSDGLDVAAQPLYELSTGRVIGVELFTRLTENGSLVSGTDVLRLAREHSEAIDAAMLGRAIAIARSWRTELGAGAPRVHMNVSAQSLASGQFVSRVRSALDRHHLSPTTFAFEVDSNDFLPIDHREVSTLLALKEMGIAVVIDGYGVGPASLRLIERIRPSLVKIASLDTGRARPMHPEVIVGLLRAVSSLGVASCVKGIESQPVLERIVQAGAFAGQGNALAPVRSISEAQPALHAHATIGF